MIKEHGIEVRVDYDLENAVACVTLRVEDATLLGKAATLGIDTVYDISEKWFDGSVPECSFDINGLEREQHFELPMTDLALMPYIGAHVSIRHAWKLQLYDGRTLEGTVWQDNIRLPAKPKPAGQPGPVVEPVDHYSFSRNFSAIDSEKRTLIVLMSAAVLIIVIVITGIGIHDQKVPNESVLLFAHGKHSHSGKSRFLRHPLGKAGAIVAVLLVLYLSALRKLLRSYISFRVSGWPEQPGPGTTLRVADLVSGRPMFSVKNLTLRIVAANYERVAYYDWMNREQVDRRIPIRAVVLYEKAIPLLKARQDLETVLGDDVLTLKPLYEKLLPPKHRAKTGIFVHWEVQLLHADFVDYEVVGPQRGFVFSDFYRYDQASPESATA